MSTDACVSGNVNVSGTQSLAWGEVRLCTQRRAHTVLEWQTSQPGSCSKKARASFTPRISACLSSARQVGGGHALDAWASSSSSQTCIFIWA